MDKNTLSNYGWVVIAVLVLAVMIALATPFGTYIKSGVESTTQGLFDTSEKAMNVVGMSAGDGSFDGDSDSSTPTKDPALNPSGTIPKGAYYGNLNSVTGAFTLYDSMPETVSTFDVYVYGDYVYLYGGDFVGWRVLLYLTDAKKLLQCDAEVTDKNQTSYGAILESINGQPVTNMENTFSYCTNLTAAPEIPDSVTDMSFTFQGCTSLTIAPEIPDSVTNMTYTFSDCSSLTTAPEIPNGVTNMESTFSGCISLTTAPEIPNGVTNMSYTFYGCTSLTGTITINANPLEYNRCFYQVDFVAQNLTLAGSSLKLAEIGATGTNYQG